MRFVLQLKMDNAAFADGDAGLELARILRELAAKLAECDGFPDSVGGSVCDVNGNNVGSWGIG